MPDFSTVQTVEWPPFGCSTCGAHVGPFVALNIDFPGQANIGLCPNCSIEIGRMNNMADPGVKEDLERQIGEDSTRISALERALDDATRVSLADAKKILSDASAPPTPAEEPSEEEAEPEAEDEDEDTSAAEAVKKTTTATAQRKRSASSTTTKTGPKRTSTKKT